MQFDHFLVWDSLSFSCKKENVGCNNRPNKEKGISIHPISFYRTVDTGEAQKKKEVSWLCKIKVCSLATRKIIIGVFKTRPRWRLLCYVFWFDYVWFLKKVAGGWYWDFDPCNLYFCRKQSSRTWENMHSHVITSFRSCFICVCSGTCFTLYL